MLACLSQNKEQKMHSKHINYQDRELPYIRIILTLEFEKWENSAQLNQFFTTQSLRSLKYTVGLAQQSRNQKIRNHETRENNNHGNTRKRTENLFVYPSRLGAK